MAQLSSAPSVPGAGQDFVSPEDARRLVERVLASDTFRGSENLRVFLAFIVEETLAGRAESLSSRTIAIGALRRPDSNDPRDQTIVRVEAGRLRNFLYRYFQDEGASEDIEILVPKGAYVPVFRRRTRSGVSAQVPAPAMESTPQATGQSEGETSATPEPPAPSPSAEAMEPARPEPDATRPPARGRRQKGSLLAVCLATGLVLLAALAIWPLVPWNHSLWPLREGARTEQAEPPARPSSSELRPLLFVEVGGRGDEAAGLAEAVDGLVSRLSRFELVRVVTGSSGSAPDRDAATRRWPLASRFVLRASACEGCATPRMNLRLQGLPDGELIHSGDVSLLPDRVETELDRIASLIAAYNGLLLNRLRETETGTSSPLACLIRLYDYFATFSPIWREPLRICFKDPRIMEQRDGLMMIGAAFMAFGDYWWEYVFRSSALDHAGRLSQMAVEAVPHAAQALHVRSFVVAAQGDHDAALRLAREAHAANPLDLTVVAAYGLRLMNVGRVGEAHMLMQRAHEGQTAPPLWLSINLALTSLELGLTAEFRRFAGELHNEEFPIAPPLRMLAAVESGSMADAREIRARFRANKPVAARLLTPIFNAYLPDPALAARVLARIEAASRALD